MRVSAQPDRQYELIEPLGAGGMAEVFRARIAGTRRHVAVKRLPSDPAPEMSAALMREAVLAERLRHPGICALLDWYWDDEARMCLVLELVEGADLARVMSAARLPINAAVYVVRTVLEALRHVHEQAHVVHRDVSPQNILVSWDGAVRLTDFGIAKAVRSAPTTGAMRGKIDYLSPEQANGVPPDGRADLFAVGSLLYRLVTGRSPYGAVPEPEVLRALMQGTHIVPPRALRADIPAELDALIMWLLAHSRNERCPSARAAIQALPPCPGGRAELVAVMAMLRAESQARPSHAPPLAPPRRTRHERPRRSRRLRGALAALALVSLLAAPPDTPRPRGGSDRSMAALASFAAREATGVESTPAHITPRATVTPAAPATPDAGTRAPDIPRRANTAPRGDSAGARSTAAPGRARPRRVAASEQPSDAAPAGETRRSPWSYRGPSVTTD